MLRDHPPAPAGLRRSARMRRVGPTYRRALEERLERWEAFGRLLGTPSERAAFARLTRGARRYVTEASYVGSPDLLESILLSVLLDLSRRLPARNERPGLRRGSHREVGPSRAGRLRTPTDTRVDSDLPAGSADDEALL
ncbi:MAG: hypothetical protein ACREDE_11625, partial [Thermoplasmata archaeon]